MKPTLQRVTLADRNTLKDMIKIYQKELLNKKRIAEYKYLDSYFEKKDRHPYFILYRNEIIGFALVNKYSVVEPNCFSIAEFYIKKEYRRKHIGKTAIFQLFDIYVGKWEIRELDNSANAQLFWRCVIKEYTHNNFKEIHLHNKNWKGPIQLFTN